MVTIEAGRSWVSTADGSEIVVQGRSDLLAQWWKVRCSSTGRARSIDEESLRSLYHPQLDENASSLASSIVAA